MKIYVNEKENIYLKYNKRCELVILDSKPVIEMTVEEFNEPIKTSTLLAYSLEQHDKELLQEFADELKTFLLDYGTVEQANIINVIDNLLKEKGE